MPPTRGLILDLDGVLLRGREAIPGAAAAVQALKRRGLRVVCCTNENWRPAAARAADLAALGIPITPAEFISGGVVAARVVAAEFPGRRVLAVGGPGLLEPLQERGVSLIGFDRAAAAEVVVMGLDKSFDYHRLDAVAQSIWRGARFLATNYDARLPVEQGFIPETGPMVKAVAYATGVEPVILGKPSHWAASTCLHALGLSADEVVVVGDQVRQDVAMARAAGMRAVLVLSGSTRAVDLPRFPPELQPDAVLDDITRLPPWLEQQGAG